MNPHIGLIAQPRSGGTFVSQILTSVYNAKYLGEYFNIDGNNWPQNGIYEEIIARRINDLKQAKESCMFSVKYHDINQILYDFKDININWFHLERLNFIEMLSSAYLTYITGIYHVNDRNDVPKLENITIPLEYVEWFISEKDIGGWYYNKFDNIDFPSHILPTRLFYNDKTTVTDILEQLNSAYTQSDIDINIHKLYDDKSQIISNIPQIKEFIKKVMY